MRIELFVRGRPRTAGSKSGFVNKNTGKVIFTPAGSRQKSWQESVRWTFLQSEYARTIPIDGAIMVSLLYSFARPKSHLTSKGKHTKSYKHFPSVRPDIDKLNRAVLDALSGLAYKDDALIVSEVAMKEYGVPEGVRIIIRKIPDTEGSLKDVEEEGK